MAKKVLLIGHCGADSSYLRILIKKADPTAEAVIIHDDEELQEHLAAGAVLALVNRLMDYGFAESEGVDVIKRLAPTFPGCKFMMISNYPDAHAAAERVGGVAGFGKRDIGSPRATALLNDALSTAAPVRQT